MSLDFPANSRRWVEVVAGLLVFISSALHRRFNRYGFLSFVLGSFLDSALAFLTYRCSGEKDLSPVDGVFSSFQLGFVDCYVNGLVGKLGLSCKKDVSVKFDTDTLYAGGAAIWTETSGDFSAWWVLWHIGFRLPNPTLKMLIHLLSSRVSLMLKTLTETLRASLICYIFYHLAKLRLAQAMAGFYHHSRRMDQVNG